MPIIPFHGLGSQGLVKDSPDHLLPPEAWTDARNVRFHDNSLSTMPGNREVFATPLGAPYWLLPVALPTDFVWIYCGLTDCWMRIGGAHEEITRISGDYTGAATDLWNGGVLGGIPIVNNGVDYPQYLATVTAGTNLADLTNWPASTYCKVIRPFKNFLVALSISDAGGTHPHMVKWSHPADPGSVPSSWNEADPAVDAGETELTDSGAGVLVDCIPLRDINIIYKEGSTWGMQYTGDQYVFDFFEIFQSTGLLTQRCARPFAMQNSVQHHLVKTQDDFIIHNGTEAQSIVDKRLHRWVNSVIDTANYTKSFVAVDQVNKEALFCFPETDSSVVNMALVWNWYDNTCTIRELVNTTYMVGGIVEETDTDYWDDDSGAWDDDTTDWDLRSYSQYQPTLLQASADQTKLYQFGYTNQWDGTSMECYVERTGLGIVGRDRRGEWNVDYDTRKLCSEIWITAEGDPFQVRLGGQEVLGGEVTWAPAQTFTPGVDKKLNFTTNGRLMCVRFQSTANVSWRVDSYSLNVNVLGRF